MMQEAPIGEDDLQLYVDGRLTPDRLAAVEAYLADTADVAARVAAERRDVEALRRSLRALIDEPIPARLRPAAIRAARRRRLLGWARSAAAGLALLLLGAGGGWVLGQRSVATPGATVAASAVSGEAVAAYRTYVVEVAHPVEVRSDNEKHLIAWLSKRLGRPLMAPDLTSFGYALMGGRLLPASQGAAAQLMYEAKGGERLTLYVGAAGGGETAFRFFQDGDAATLAWLDQGYGFAVTAALSRDALTPIAEAVYRALDGAAGRG